MYKYLIFISLFALSACTFGQPTPPAPVDWAKAPAPVQSPVGASMPKNAVISLNYTLREGAPDGKILETTKENVAQANNLYKSGSKYIPFEVVLGTSAVIPGFEAGIASMKQGEKKMIQVLPKDGYGEASVTRTVKESEVAPDFTITTDKSQFEDRSIQTVQRNMLGEQGKSVSVGQTLTGWANVTAKVTKIDGDNITLEINNVNNPFYGKKLVVGEKAKKENISFEVKAMTASGVTMRIINGDSPFAGKAFVAWASAPIPGRNGAPSPGDIKILSISGESINITVPNPHPLAGKTLYFEVEVLSIK